MSKRPLIALVGRPNVGKSTLFNRLIGRRYAVISKIPGTTRDRLYHPATFENYSVMLIDTGGLDFGKHHDIETQVQIQSKIAMADADIIYFLIDASEEMTLDDYEAAKLLRKTKKPVFLLAHKSDRKSAKDRSPELYSLGFGEPMMISSMQGQGIQNLIDTTVSALKKLRFQPFKDEKPADTIRLVLIGRPNVGKSTLLNCLVGEERVIVAETPGTTRDTIDTELTVNDQKFLLMDTAGIRRRGLIKPGLEKFSVLRALEVIYRCDIVILLIDVTEGVTNQDCHITEFALDASKGLILAVNKCDLMTDKKADETAMINLLQRKMRYIPWAPAVFLSARTGENVSSLLPLAKTIFCEQFRSIEDSIFQHFLKQITIKHPAPSRGARLTRLYGGKQIKTHPPTFQIYTNQPDAIHFSYRRYIENEIRKKFGFMGTAIKLQFTSRRH